MERREGARAVVLAALWRVWRDPRRAPLARRAPALAKRAAPPVRSIRQAGNVRQLDRTARIVGTRDRFAFQGTS